MGFRDIYLDLGKASEISFSTNNFLCRCKSPGTAAKPSALRRESQVNCIMDNKETHLRNYTELKLFLRELI